MLTIVKTPPTVAFCGNPVLFKLSSDNLVATAGVKSQCDIRVSTIDTVAGHSFLLNVGSAQYTFTLAAVPDDSGNQLPTATGGQPWVLWAIALKEGLEQNFYLRSLYDITLPTTQPTYQPILITAKYPGTEYSVSFHNNNVTGLTGILTVPGVDEVVRTDFGVTGILFDKDENAYGQEIRPIDNDEAVWFDMADYIASKIEAVTDDRFTWPEVAGNFVKAYIDAYIVSYKAGFAEFYDNIYQRIHFDTTRYGILGGLSRERLARYNDQESDYFSTEDNLMRFLTWAPASKVTGSLTPEKLFFLFQAPAGYSRFRLVCNIVYSDASVYKFNATALDVFNQYSVIECLVGYDQLDLASKAPAKTVSSWQVWLENERGTQISEVRSFTLDPLVYDKERCFLFRNSFAAYDVVRFTGVQEMTSAVERVSGSSFPLDEITDRNAPGTQFSAAESPVMKISSGWVPVQMKDYLRELLVSNEIYEIVDGALWKIQLNTVKFFVKKDKETLYSADFEYRRSWTNQYYSGQEQISSVPVPGSVPLTADNDIVTADDTTLTADQTQY
jgi:hypothetical protein